ncbi:MAG: CDF family Co(II)/Ni(II) efflux transporter DmeF [Pseudomonadota bacterium]
MDGDGTTTAPAFQADGRTPGGRKACSGERKTRIAVALTLAAMTIEIGAGLAFGSMALLADGLHMAGHAAALGVALFAYVYARRRADDKSFNFGVGKVNALGGYTSAVLLAIFALAMAWESGARFLNPIPINYDMALAVAVFGLTVNIASALILHDDHHHSADGEPHDHNLHAAYMHVLADALTSVLAIVALLAGKLWGAAWLDPMMGIVGAVVVTVWAYGLIKRTSALLLDREPAGALCEDVRQALERSASLRDSDAREVRLWRIGPHAFALEAVMETSHPIGPEEYRRRLPKGLPIETATIEVRRVQPASTIYAAE